MQDELKWVELTVGFGPRTRYLPIVNGTLYQVYLGQKDIPGGAARGASSEDRELWSQPVFVATPRAAVEKTKPENGEKK